MSFESIRNKNFEASADGSTSSSGENDADEKCKTDTTPQKKKAKRLCRFQTSWESEFTWCRKVSGNCFEAHCVLCCKKFSVGHGGRNDLTAHTKSDLHKRNVVAAKSESVRSFFVKSTPTGIDRQVRNTHFIA
jgi:hypothetical protein